MQTQPETEPLIGLVKLMRIAHAGEDLTPLGKALIARAETDATGHALMDLSTVLQLIGNRELAMSMQAQAIATQQIYAPPTVAEQVKIRLLAIMGAGDLMANTPLEFLMENSDIALHIVYVTEKLPLPAFADLPEHDVLFVAVAQSDQNLPLLKTLETTLAAWPRPVLNKPEQIRLTSRHQTCELLKGIPHVDMPITVRVTRTMLEQVVAKSRTHSSLLADGDFPIIVRPIDSHAGQGLDKIADANELHRYLTAMPDNSEFHISRFVDYRGQDGLFRKYRIVLIEGKPFICHLGISENWMIHYLNAGMTESPEKRAEEAQFMQAFDNQFAAKHADALAEIYVRVGMDYLGIDCAENAEGSLLIFEIDGCMVVHAIDPIDIFPYKQPQMQKVFGAFRQMLLNASAPLTL